MRGRCFVVSGPSGVGKETVINKIRNTDSSLGLITTFTTRHPRNGEVNGREYHFITTEEFQKKIRSGHFLEHAEYAGNFYGTSRESVVAQLERGKDILLEIECVGARQVKRALQPFVSTIFITASLEVLESRLIARGKDTSESIVARLKKAEEEIEHIGEYDFVVDNGVGTVSETAQKILDYINYTRGLASV